MKEIISIRSLVSLSPLGISGEGMWQAYLNNDHYIQSTEIGGQQCFAAPLPPSLKEKLHSTRKSDSEYKELDDSVLMAILAARKAVQQAGWEDNEDIGVNIGSSRGATGLFEKYHGEFIKTGRTSTLTSPTTTLGNISSWVAHDLKSPGPEISHSITCSTSLHAMLNAIAWLKGGMATKFLVGGSEAPLTAFTIAQMKALKIYAGNQTDYISKENEYPCRALDLNKKKNSMVLGEAASVACLEHGVSDQSLAIVEGVGYATEPLQHSVSLSADAACLQASMSMAIQGLDPAEIDVVVMHAPGTFKGDQSEFNAISSVFGKTMPARTTNKWKLGHCFGASGMLSVELAVYMLRKQRFISVPYTDFTKAPGKIKRVLVNAVGFGGNAVSILLRNIEE